MSHASDYSPDARDAGHRVGEVRVSAEMRMFDRLPRSLQQALRYTPVPIMAMSVMDLYLRAGESRTMRALNWTVQDIAPGSRPVLVRAGWKRPQQVPESEAYVVPRRRGRRRAR